MISVCRLLPEGLHCIQEFGSHTLVGLADACTDHSLLSAVLPDRPATHMLRARRPFLARGTLGLTRLDTVYLHFPQKHA
jgi:hypothetical protein